PQSVQINFLSTTTLPPRSTSFFQNLHRIQCPIRCVLVLEICEHISSLANMFADSVHHSTALIGCVGGLAVAVIAEISGHNIGRDSLFGFGYAKRPIAAFQQIEDVISEPRSVTKLECRMNAAWNVGKKFRQQLRIGF